MVLDDCDDMAGVQARLVQTNGATGLTDADVDRAIALLTGLPASLISEHASADEALPELSDELVHALLTNDDGVCSDPDCWRCYSPLRPENLRRLAGNLAIGAALCRAWQHRGDDPTWRPGCSIETESPRV